MVNDIRKYIDIVKNIKPNINENVNENNIDFVYKQHQELNDIGGKDQYLSYLEYEIK